MRKITIACLLMMWTGSLYNNCHAQHNDSLDVRLKAYTKEDTIRINLLFEVYAGSKDFEETIRILDEAISLSIKLNAKEKLARAYLYKAIELTGNGDFSAADQYIHLADSAYKETNSKTGTIKVFRQRGFIAQLQSEYYEAINHFKKAIEYALRENDTELLGTLHNDVAVCYSYISDFAASTDYYIKAGAYYEKAKLLPKYITTITNIARNNRILRRYTTALTEYRNALHLATPINDESNTAFIYQGIGITYDEQGKSDSSLFYFKKALSLSTKLNQRRKTAELLNSIGIILKNQHEYDSSYAYMSKARAIFNELKFEQDVKHVDVNIGELLCTAPESFFNNNTVPLAERYSRARLLFQTVVNYANDAGNKVLESNAWLGLSVAYGKSGNYKEAYHALSKHIDLKDSTINEEVIENVARQQEAVEFAKKEAILQATHESEIQQEKTTRHAILFGAGILLAGGILSFLFYQRKRNAVVMQKEAEFKAEVAETEMKALRAQMNPHFLFNSLNSIGNFISNQKTDIAGNYLTKFAKLMRLVLENSEKKEICLADDLKALELYMQLECMRLNYKFQYEIKIDNIIDPENTLIPPLLLQPFVENSIWHGIAHKDGAGKIFIHVFQQDAMIKCVVEDNGIGRKQSEEINTRHETTEKKSVGMKITNARINILNKVKNKSAGIQLIDLAQGTRVELSLPLETY